jgi:hypothetical protein
MIRILGCAALFALAPLPALAQDYVGTWASQPAQCRNGQEVEEAPLVMKRSRYDQHETHCMFSSVSKRGAAWAVKSRCQVEGTNVASDFTMQVRGATLTMTDKMGARTLQRCP